MIYYLGNLAYTTELTTARGIGCLLDYSEETAARNQAFLDAVDRIDIEPFGGYITRDGAIESPLQFILYYYGSSSYTLTSTSNSLANPPYIPFYVIPDTNACTVAAIAGVACVNPYSITGSFPTWSTIYATCLQVGINGGYYTPSGGTPSSTNLANAVLSYYGSSWTASFSFLNIYSVCKTQIDNCRGVVINIK